MKRAGFTCSPFPGHTLWECERNVNDGTSTLQSLSFSSVSLSLADYRAFQEASERFQPYIKFFATFDKTVSLNVQKKKTHSL